MGMNRTVSLQGGKFGVSLGTQPCRATIQLATKSGDICVYAGATVIELRKVQLACKAAADEIDAAQDAAIDELMAEKEKDDAT